MPVNSLGWFFGAYLGGFAVITFLFAWWIVPRNFLRPRFAFALLLGLSLLFVLAFVVRELPRTEIFFTEIGQYYPAEPDFSPQAKQPTASQPPILSVGDESEKVDYIVQPGCNRAPCFKGRIDFSLELKANSPTLSWNVTGVPEGLLRIEKVSLGRWARMWRVVWGLVPAFRNYQTSPVGQITLDGEQSVVSINWEAPSGPQSEARRITYFLRVETNPENTVPRIVVETEEPRSVPLTELNNRPDDNEDVRTVYLTSANQAVALRSKEDRYIPTIKVGESDPLSNVNAFLSLPVSNSEPDDFIVNNGLSRTGSAFNHQVYVGGRRGIEATVSAKGGRDVVLRYVLSCLVIWVAIFLLFLPLVDRVKLYAFIPAIQALLAVKFILSLRCYLFSPYSAESIETAVLAFLLVPLMVSLGCYATNISMMGRLRHNDENWRGYLLKEFRPIRYFLFFALLLPSLYWVLQDSSAPNGWQLSAFRNWNRFLGNELVLVGLPIAVFVVSLFVDWVLRDRRADTDYKKYPEDPISYCVVRSEDLPDAQRPLGKNDFIALLVTVLLIGLPFLAFGVAGLFKGYLARALGGIVVGAFALGAAFTAKRLADWLQPVNLLSSRAAKYAGWLLKIIGTLLLARGLWNLVLGWWQPANSAAFFSPLRLSIRTTTVFEFIILILTMRLLVPFFSRWSERGKPFGARGFFEAAIVFSFPAVLLALTLLASRDTGSLLVHGPAFIGITLLITGLWSAWKATAGRRDALLVLVLAAMILFVYYGFAFSRATTLIPFLSEKDTIIQRTLLLEGTQEAAKAAEQGGSALLGAIEQHWRMLDYAAEGGLKGLGFGGAPVPSKGKFRDISLDDLVFSTYVLADYGGLGGVALLCLYLLVFGLSLSMMWLRLREEPLRLAFAGGLALMILFPALYMAAANVNQVIFTGQAMPLLGLRSLSDLVRVAVALYLLVACVRPAVESPAENRVAQTPSWLRLNLDSLALFRVARAARRLQLENLRYDIDTAGAAVASNTGLVLFLVIIAFVVPIVGIVKASNNEDYKNDLDFAYLEERARTFIQNGHIWFEPIQSSGRFGGTCRGGLAKNSIAPSSNDPTLAYQICTDAQVRGARFDDTFSELASEWNKRKAGRGNSPSRNFDSDQFFQLDLERIPSLSPRKTTANVALPLSVNPGKFQVRSPFHSQRTWLGSLTEQNMPIGDGGVLVGAGIVLPLRAARYDDEPVFVGATNPGFKEVHLGSPGVYDPQRGFAVSEASSGVPIFNISTVSGSEGALLSPESGDFKLFLNGCPLFIDKDSKCSGLESRALGILDKGTAPKLRLEDGDVIGYAGKDKNGKLVAKDVFVYSHAELGAFSYVAWVNGVRSRYYPQGESWPMARQISEAINLATESKSDLEAVEITVDSDLNRQIYDLLRTWRRCLDGSAAKNMDCARFASPLVDTQSSRVLAVTLLDPNTGEIVALADDDGKPNNPNTQNGMDDFSQSANGNLVRHRIGSAIKPFTAAASLNAFNDLHRLLLVDHRSNKTTVLGLPLGGKDVQILPRGANEISWDQFLPISDNLYAITLSLLGMSKSRGTSGLPSFSRGDLNSNGGRLELNDRDSYIGKPDWDNLFYYDGKNERIELLEQTPLARNLESLFSLRAASPPQAQSFNADIWARLSDRHMFSEPEIYNKVSPEIPNFAFDDIHNFADLRSVLLGGEFADLPQYGRVGAAWSNVYLAQSFSRIVTGRLVTARILGQKKPPAGAPSPFAEWFPGASGSPWRQALMRGLEGVAVEPGSTAYSELNGLIAKISGRSPQRVLGSGQRHFTIFAKTGTLEVYRQGNILEDSIFVFTAGIWNDASRTFERPVTGAIYFEQGKQKRAQAFAAELLALLDNHPRFSWSSNR